MKTKTKRNTSKYTSTLSFNTNNTHKGHIIIVHDIRHERGEQILILIYISFYPQDTEFCIIEQVICTHYTHYTYIVIHTYMDIAPCTSLSGRGHTKGWVKYYSFWYTRLGLQTKEINSLSWSFSRVNIFA